MPFELEKNIQFFFDGTRPTLRRMKELKLFLLSIFASEEIEVETVNFIFSADKTVRAINKKYLGHDFFTDIVTFNLARKGKPVVGDVYVSIDRVRENALSQGEPFERELHRVIFHGTLHLCGYKDKSKSQIREMRNREDHYLAGYFR